MRVSQAETQHAAASCGEQRRPRRGAWTDDNARPDLVVRLTASFTSEPFVPSLRFWFDELALRGEVDLAPYGQVLQTLLAPAAPGSPRSVQVVVLRLRDWLRELPAGEARSETFLRAYLDTTANDFERALRTHRAQATGDTLLVLCPSALERQDDAEPLIARTEADLLERLAALPGLTAVRAADFHARHDVDDKVVADHLRDRIAHIPYQKAYFHTLATIVMRHVHRTLTPARKVVVVDCDNTLWSGVVGEVGAEGLIFHAGHRALHRTLDRLARNGVLIGLCSKNEEADVWRVFEARDDFALRREQIVAAAINWLPKSENLKALAARLNLGLDSVVFIDDNPVECAEVRAACPEVLTLEWPQDPDRAIQLLEHTWELDVRPATAEDRRRTELYREEFRRQELQAQTLSFRDFVASLDLVVDVAPLDGADLARASQLTLRTNQFNFTTRRRQEGELQALAAGGAHEIRTVRVRDRFGDYGLVGLLVAEHRDDEVVADTFLLSCRVLGRGVEHRMLAELGRLAGECGAVTVRLRVEPTPRNTPARAFLDAVAPSQFRQDEGEILQAILPAEWAAAVVFDPPEGEQEIRRPGGETGDQEIRRQGQDDASRGPAAVSLRVREAQIARTAFELSSMQGLARAIDGASPASTGAAPAGSAAADASIVYEAFARALGMSAARIREIDSLEALGCDSFTIVEITVGLLERWPWLPATLLFEHRTVSEIARHVDELTAARPAPAVSRPAARPVAPASTDVAVVGMHVRCAGARSPDELWDLLSTGGVAVAQVPPDRRCFFGRLEDSRPHFAGLVDEVDGFEPELFGITPREAELMDPQQRLFLEVAWNALEDAGCLASIEPDTGVFAGVMYGDYGHRANLLARSTGTPIKSWESFSLANRLSHIFGFRGPSLAVDTACSSSGTALHLACRALADGDCRVAIAGGVNLILDPDRFVQLGRLGILSPSGRCLAFGAEADGTVLGEGAAVVVLRPLAEALRRGDRIYGVIRATAVSTGSGTVGFTAPNPQAQAEAIRRAVQRAGIDPRTISYVETHGTGTALGDPIEVRGLTLAYGDPSLSDAEISGTQTCTIGSIKPNVGHLEAGAAVLGLVKILLQMRQGMLVPSVTSTAPNPQIPFAQTPLSIQRTLSPWTAPVLDVAGAPTAVPRRAALNSFGVGGANVHVIVEEAPSAAVPESTADRPHHLLTLSARTGESLQRRAAGLAGLLAADAGLPLADVCFSANTGQRPLARRAALAARTRDDMIASLRRLAAGDDAAGAVQGVLRSSSDTQKIGFLFTGQGSQYPGMGRELYESQPVFREALDRAVARFEPLLGCDLRDVMFAAKDTADGSRLDETGFTQPALFTLGYALAELWRSWGVRPDVVLGHSIGELTAMCAAGGLTLDDAAILVAARGRLMQALPAGGAMMAVMAAEPRVREALGGYDGRVAVAAINGPAQTVVSGEGRAIAELADALVGAGIRTKPLVVSHAFHSPLMQPMLAEYEAVVRSVELREPEMPVASCVLGRMARRELTDPGYWIRNVMDTVRFTDGIRALQAQGVTAAIELGPQPVLTGMAQQSLEDAGDALWLASMRRDTDTWPVLLASLGRLYVAGAAIDWHGFDHPYRRRRVSLPPYPFARRRFWLKGAGTTVFAAPPREEEDAGPRHASSYEIAWREQPAAGATGARDVPMRWLILGDPGGLGAALARELEAAGAQCTVWPSGGEPLETGLSTWLQTDAAPAGVVHLIALDAASASAASPAVRAAAAVEDLCAAMRAIAGVAQRADVRLWVATRHAVPAGLDMAAPLDVAHAPLWGAGRTFALEHPEMWGGLVDVAADWDRDVVASRLAAELLSSGVEDQVALRQRSRLVPRLVRRPAAPDGPAPVTGTGTYLVTGGLGALGLHTARWLVSHGARHLVLTSRRGAGTPGASEAVRDLESSGAVVTVVSADVSRPGDVAGVFETLAAKPPLAGVFHAAGIDDTTPIEAMRPGDAAAVMAAKTTGAWLLHERTAGSGVQMFASFSSIASVLGSAGRAAYAAANAFLDGLAHERRRVGLPALSINWGPWAGGGMASDAALDQYRRVGNRGLVPEEALRQMEALLTSGATQVAVADIDWTAFRAAYESRRPRPFVSELGEPDPSALDARVPEVAWADRLAEMPEPQRLDEMVGLLCAEVAATLGLESAEDVPPDQPLRDMGMDSLMSADFAQRLQKRLGIRSTALVFEHPTVRLLAAHLAGRLAASHAPAMPVAALAVGGEVATGAPAGAPAAPSPPAITVPSVARTDGYSPDVEDEVFAFCRRAWPARRADWIAPRWRWMFVESARRMGVPPRVWLHRQDGAIVGHNGAIPVRLKIGHDERDTAWLVETMVLAEYRSQAVGARLTSEAHDDLPFALSLGQTEQMRAIQLRLGWEQVVPLQTAQLLLRPERVLEAKLPRPAALAASLALRATAAVREVWKGSISGEVRALERFDASHDALWTVMARNLTCAVRRDSSYLNWKYVDQPGQDLVRLELRTGGEPRGVIVLMFREPTRTYKYRRAFIVDVVAPLPDSRVVADLLQAATRAALEGGAAALVCLHTHTALTRALSGAGFRLRRPDRFLLVLPGGLEPRLRARLLDPDAWFVTHGDSDIDRPW
jgi:FkbH-like protein